MKLKAPQGVLKGKISVAGVPYVIENGHVDVEPDHAQLLVETHGFTVAKAMPQRKEN